MATAVNIFSVAPARIGGVDMLVPLFAEISQAFPSSAIEIIFLETRIAHEVNIRPQLEKDVLWVSKRCTRLNWDDTQHGMARYVVKVCRLLPLMARILISRKPILIHSRANQTRVVDLLGRCARLKGGTVLGHPDMQTVFFGRSNELSRKIQSDINGWLAFGAGEGSVRPKSSDDLPVHIMGYTKLYPAWQQHLKVLARDLRRRLFPEEQIATTNRAQCPVTFAVFSGSVVETVYSEDDLRFFFDEVFSVLSKEYPGSQVLVKCHPMDKSDISKDAAALAQGLKIHFVDDHPGAVAASSNCVIATHTSAIIDSLGYGTPTILHQKFSNEWMQRHPEKSSFLSLGVPYSHDSKTLEKAISIQLSSHCILPDIRKVLRHRVDLSVFAKAAGGV